MLIALLILILIAVLCPDCAIALICLVLYVGFWCVVLAIVAVLFLALAN